MRGLHQLTVAAGTLAVALAGISGCTSMALKPAPPKADFITPLATGPETPPQQITQKQSIEAALTAAREFERNGFDGEAIAQYQRARDQGSADPEIPWRLAVLHDRMGNLSLAKTEYELALKFSPKNPDLWNDWGYFQHEQEDYPGARESLEQALTIKPDHQRASMNLGMTLAMMERYDEALARFAKVVGPGAAQSNLGVILAQQGKLQEARTAFETAHRLDPTLEQPKSLLAGLQTDSHRPVRVGMSTVPTPE